MTESDRIHLWKMLLLAELIILENILAERPPRTMDTDDHRQIHFAHISETITLKCPIEFSEYPTFVEWLKGNSSLYMMQGYQITQKGYLKIKSVTHQHAGTYTCEGINGYGSVRVNLTLIIDNPEIEIDNDTLVVPNSAKRIRSYAPSITKRPLPTLVDGVGAEVTFHCVASGHPMPHIFWLNEGRLINDSSSYISNRKTHSILRLRDLKESDAGLYKCIARNRIGEDEMDFTLQVKVCDAISIVRKVPEYPKLIVRKAPELSTVVKPTPPPRIIAVDPPNVSIHEGATATFVCHVTSKPGGQVHIKWLKKYHTETAELNANLFRLDTTYYQPLNLSYSISTTSGVYKSKLVIRNSGKEDAGTYVCLALNNAGFNFKNCTLNMINPATSFSSPAHFSTSGITLVIVTVAFVVILSAFVFVTHKFCRSKTRGDSSKVMDAESFRQSTASVRKLHIGSPLPESNEPQPISKLLGSDYTL